MRAAIVVTRRNARDVVRPEAAYLLNGRESQIDFQDAARISFEKCAPVRQFPSWRGKRNYSGSYWSSTMQKHVGFESLYERTALMTLDREPTIVAISSQPMWIFWPATSTPKSHAPDFFVRHDNGDGEIIDVRPHERIDDSAIASFEATRRLCDQHGFQYRVISTLDRTVDQNLRFLSRYREPLWQPPLDRISRLEDILDRPLPIRSLSSWISYNNHDPAALGWIYWLIWSGRLEADLCVPIRLDSIVRLSQARRS